MALPKFSYEAALGRPLTDEEYAKLSGNHAPAPSASAYDSGMSNVPQGAGYEALTAVPSNPSYKPSFGGSAPTPAELAFVASMQKSAGQANPNSGLPGQAFQPPTKAEAAFASTMQTSAAPLASGPPSIGLPPPASAPAPAAATPVGPPPMAAAPAPAPRPMPRPVGPPAAPSAPIDVTNFGKTPHEIAFEKQGQKSAIEQMGYQNQLSEAEVEQAGAFEQIAAKAAADADARAAATEQSMAKRKAFLDTYNADTTRAIEEFGKAEVDPNKYWADKGTGGTLLAAIGVALGGWAQGMAAGAGQRIENGGLEMIEKGIARDIELQKAAIAKKGAGIEMRKGLYGQYLQQFGNEDAAEAMAYETYLRKAKSEIDAQAAKTTNKEVKIRAEALGASLEDRIIQAANGKAIAGEKMYDQYQAKKQQAAAAAANAMAAEMKARNKAIVDANLKALGARIEKSGGTIVPAAENIPLGNGAFIPAGMPVAYNAKGQIDMEGTEAAQKIATVNMPVLQPGGTVAFSATPVQKDGYSKAAEKAAGATNAIKAIEQMEKAAAMPGPWVGEKKKLYEQAISNYSTAYGVANGMGALSGEDLKIVRETIPEVPTYGVGFLSDAQMAQLTNQKKAMAEQAQAAVQVYGTPGTAGPAPLMSAGKPQ